MFLQFGDAKYEYLSMIDSKVQSLSSIEGVLIRKSDKKVLLAAIWIDRGVALGVMLQHLQHVSMFALRTLGIHSGNRVLIEIKLIVGVLHFDPC